MWEEAQLLVDDPDAVLASHDGRTDDDRDAVEFNLARVRANDAGKHFHQRRFARAVFSDDSMNVAAADGQVHIVDRDHPSVTFAEAADSDERSVDHVGSVGNARQLSRAVRPVERRAYWLSAAIGSIVAQLLPASGPFTHFVQGS